MAGNFIGMKPGLVFFDHKKLRKNVDRKKIRFLARFGAFVRRSARSSIKPGGKSGKTSAPGEPPRSQTGYLKRGIFFAYNLKTESVVIGPIIVPTKYGGPNVLQSLEEGGSVMAKIASVQAGGRNAAGQFTKKKLRGFKTVKADVKARPFMGPAFQKELKNISSIWGSS